MDADSVMGYKIITNAFANVRVTMELADETYVRFVGRHLKGMGSNTMYALWDTYRSGRILCSSFLDSIICQLYHYGQINEIIVKLLGITKNNKRLKPYKESRKIRSICLPD
jgi:hypothetical protein